MFVRPIFFEEYVVLIPLEKTATLNIVSIERRLVRDLTDKNILHVGSGRNVDFIIYKNSEIGRWRKETFSQIEFRSTIFFQLGRKIRPPNSVRRSKFSLVTNELAKFNKKTEFFVFGFINSNANDV